MKEKNTEVFEAKDNIKNTLTIRLKKIEEKKQEIEFLLKRL